MKTQNRSEKKMITKSYVNKISKKIEMLRLLLSENSPIIKLKSGNKPPIPPIIIGKRNKKSKTLNRSPFTMISNLFSSF